MVIVAVCKCVFPVNNERSEHVVLYTHSRKRKNRKKEASRGGEREERLAISCRQKRGERSWREGDAHMHTGPPGWMEIDRTFDLVDMGARL